MDSFADLVSPASLGAVMPLLPLVGFLLVALIVSIVIRARMSRQNEGFVKSYFIGNRALGGFVLAMTTIATYGSVSSFVGGPGQAWQIGFGWVYMAVVQVTALVLLYGIFGKKMGLVARKINAVTVVDVIRARYGSNLLANLSALVIVLFFVATMVAQFVGGAKLFSAVTGYSYIAGLALFGVAVILFTTIGGFRGVAVTDALCGIAMLVGIAVLAWGILEAGGGYEAIMDSIARHNPEMLEPFSGGSMPPSLYVTQWMLVGVLTFVLPQSVVRTLGYKDTKSLHSAMIWGTLIIGAMMIGVTALGVLSAGVLTEDLATYGGSVDNIIPTVIVQSLPPMVAGVAIIGPVAASISTVSSLLISSSSAIIKDVFLHACETRGITPNDTKVAGWSQFFTLGIGALVFVLAVVPPDVIWKINMFAFGGLETAFFFVLVCGLFWKRANALGAVMSMVAGVGAYCTCMAVGFAVAGLHQIVIGMFVSFIFMVVGSLIGRQRRNAQLEVFFPPKEELILEEIVAAREISIPRGPAAAPAPAPSPYPSGMGSAPSPYPTGAASAPSPSAYPTGTGTAPSAYPAGTAPAPAPSPYPMGAAPAPAPSAYPTGAVPASPAPSAYPAAATPASPYPAASSYPTGAVVPPPMPPMPPEALGVEPQQSPGVYIPRP